MAEGTLNVATDLQARTDQNPLDQLLMVNAETKEVQGVTIEQLTGSLASKPTPNNESIIIV